jgi:general secretion pathway protein G
MNHPMKKLSVECENGSNNVPCSKRLLRERFNRGFTLIEVIIVIAIIGTLSAIAIPNYLKYKYEAMVALAITDIRLIEKDIKDFVLINNQLPNNINGLTNFQANDPWGNPYRYLRIDGGLPSAPGLARKDRFLVPVNSDYDLYSMGKDGRSRAPFTANFSQDDIVRANDGAYVGLVSNY